MANHISIHTNGNGDIIEEKANTSNSAPEGMAQHSVVKVKEGSMSLQMGAPEGEAFKVKLPTYELTDTADREAAAPASVLATAKSTMGRPLAPREVTPDTLVRVGGMQMKAAQAEAAGFLEVDGGVYVDVN